MTLLQFGEFFGLQVSVVVAVMWFDMPVLETVEGDGELMQFPISFTT